ncbi:BACON domain-containing protein [Bacteroides sp. 51]|uniref:BACON domain-containing protein n=1 Tax=Bacteroides sp. 51 TaxID=2302938 RepID=UPI0013D14691|nr:BACON domain-containing carbohydrate-binding protein [Bacteroides sp. 51]NDV80978.1 hypothetical protein [Bacteroides sp. 51]
MKKRLLLILPLCMALFLVSCSDDKSEPEKAPVIEIIGGESAVTLPETGTGSTTVSFTTNAAWQITTSDTRATPSWFDVSPKSGGAGTQTLTVSIKEENDGYDDRSGYIKIVSGDIQKYVTVTQKKKNAILITQSRYEVAMDGEEIEVEVKANVDFTVDIKNPEWIHQNKTRALTTSKLRFKIDASEEANSREGQIVISSGDLSETVKIYQAGGEVLVITQKEYAVSDAGTTIQVEVRSNTEYTVKMPDVGWIKESTTRGASAYTKYYDISPNETYDSRTTSLVFSTTTKSEEVTITQAQKDAIIVTKPEYGFDQYGGTLTLEVEHNIDFDVTIDVASRNWITPITTRALAATTLRFTIAPQNSKNERSGTITISKGELKQTITIKQEGASAYISTDYSADGKFITLQEATVGNGIDIVLMGDAFSDRLIANGTYEQIMRKAMEKCFTEEPFKSFRNLFNVYMVNVVSENEDYDEGSRTGLEGEFGGGTLVSGNDNKCFAYAQRAVSYNRMDEVLIIVMMNSTNYAGTCYMYYPKAADLDYSQGPSIAYFPIGDNDETLEQLLHHEACGHGFAKLADEYAYQSQGAISDREINESYKPLEPYGWWKNVDFTNNREQVKWAKFLSDPRYQYDGLGTYEGACTYWTKAYRPTEHSIMRHNVGGFNAPSREAIYYRMHKLANGERWLYNYEDFVAYDAINRTASANAIRQKQASRAAARAFIPQTPPVVVKHSWDEVK